MREGVEEFVVGEVEERGVEIEVEKERGLGVERGWDEG